MFGAIVYLIFAEGTVQEWAKPPPSEEVEKKSTPAENNVENGIMYLSGSKEKEMETGVLNRGYSYDISLPDEKIMNDTKF